MKAIDDFDSRKNVRFPTYAVWWIRAYMTRYLKENRGQVRGGEGERQSMVDFSLDAAVGADSESTYLDRLGDPAEGPPGPDNLLARGGTLKGAPDCGYQPARRLLGGVLR